MRGSAVRASCSGERITAEAWVSERRALCFALEKKLICPAAACSREPTCRMLVAGSPATRPPSREAISPRVNGPGMASFRRRLAVQSPDDPVGNVDARAEIDDVLQDQVELLLLGDLPDDPVRLLHHRRELLVATLVQVLAELALLALELAVHVAELPLLRPALVVAHRHRVLVQVVLHALELVGHASELLVALLELGLDLLLRAHCRRRVPQDALGVDEAELSGGSRLLGGGGKRGH